MREYGDDRDDAGERAGGLRPISYGLKRVLAGLGAPSPYVLRRLTEHWAEVVGPDLATGSEPLWIAHGELLVRATDAAVAARLRWSQRDLLVRLAGYVGRGTVRRIRVRTGRPGRFGAGGG